LAVALAFLSVIPAGNLLLQLPWLLPLLFFLSFSRESAVAVALAVALAFLSVIPAGNLLLSWPSRHPNYPGLLSKHFCHFPNGFHPPIPSQIEDL
jgi:phosphotransferase system  glucose/maltose/N-acetylglucosamine-specific IIC component